MIVLGIDPGYATVGFGAVAYEKGKFTPLEYGAVKTDPGLSFQARLFEIHRDILSLIDHIKPDAVAVEELFFNTNVKTAIEVGHARGVIVLAITEKGIPFFEYTPLEVKQAVVGYGRAEKRQVMEMTKVLLKLSKMPKPDDAADALAIAICHAHTASSQLHTQKGEAGCFIT